jgi:myo-inositol-1-phosphate synthase
LAGLDDLVSTGWDPFEDDMDMAAKGGRAGARSADKVKPLSQFDQAAKAVFDRNYVKKPRRPSCEKRQEQDDLAEQVRADIRDFKKSSGAARLITIWCGSTEIFTGHGSAPVGGFTKVSCKQTTRRLPLR